MNKDKNRSVKILKDVNIGRPGKRKMNKEKERSVEYCQT